jgi:predicted Fe-S protein YdhL (DUF1289 family)
VIHAAAKRLVAQMVDDWVNMIGQRPMLMVKCTCGVWREPLPIPKPLFVEVEKGAAGGYVADVRLGLREEGVAALELVVSHPMEAEKRSAYNALLAWWCEIAAAPVLEDPPRLEVLSMGGEIDGRDWVCLGCLRERAKKMAGWVKAAHEAKQQIEQAATRTELLKELEYQTNRSRALLMAKADELGPLIKRELVELEEIRARAAGARRAANEVEAERLLTVQKLEDVKKELKREDYQLAAVRLLDLRQLEKTYRAVFDATEALRVRGMRLARQVEKQEARLGLRAVEPTTEPTSSESP